jgi:hypothetical protein
MLSPALKVDQVVPVREPRQKRLFTATGMVKPFHRKQFLLDSVVRLIHQSTGHGHLGVFKHRVPAYLLLLESAPDALPISHPCSLRHIVSKVA